MLQIEVATWTLTLFLLSITPDCGAALVAIS